jgi:hypothetical protein
MTRPDPGPTEVRQWLTKHNAAAFADAFDERGFVEMADVKADVIRDLVDIEGTADRLIRVLNTERAKPERPAPLPVPALPAGEKFDLSAPTLTSSSGVTFQLPAGLSVRDDGQPIERPGDLSAVDWMVIARDSTLLYGFAMNGALPVLARVPLLEWVIPATTDFMRSETHHAQTRTSVSYTEEGNTFVSMGFNSQTATAAFPFASGSVERQRRERDARSAEIRELFMTGMWRYPRVTLQLDRCTQVSPRFVAAARAAVEDDDPIAALEKLFDDYGHVYSGTVLLGGLLFFQQKTVTSKSVATHEVETTLKAAMNVKMVGKGEGGAGAVFQDATGKTVSAQSMAEQVSWDVIGGDVHLRHDPTQWSQSLKRADKWAVIDRERLTSVLELLDEELKARIYAIAPQYAWRSVDGLVLGVEQQANNDKSDSTWVAHRRFGAPDTGAIMIANAMAWSADYGWGNSRIHLTTGQGSSPGSMIVRGGRQMLGTHAARLTVGQTGLSEMSQWGSSDGNEVVLMEGAAWGPNEWKGSSYVSLFLEKFGPQTTEGFLIRGGRVEIGSANSDLAFARHNVWGDEAKGSVKEQLIGEVRMWNAGRNAWGMGRIYLHVSAIGDSEEFQA